jgi:cbb3-type cytochrome oxidase subunit 3
VNDYNTIRTLVDSYGLGVMIMIFAMLILWALRPGLGRHYDEAARMIFAEENERDTTDRDANHG